MMRFLLVLNTLAPLVVAAGRETAGADQVTLMQRQISIERNLNEASPTANVAPDGAVYLMGPAPFFLPIHVHTKVSLGPEYEIDLTKDPALSAKGEHSSLLQIAVQGDTRKIVTSTIAVVVVVSIILGWLYVVTKYGKEQGSFPQALIKDKEDMLVDTVAAGHNRRRTEDNRMLANLDTDVEVDAIDKHAKSPQKEDEERMQSSSKAPEETLSSQNSVLPPVCPTLVLNDCEARCAVDVTAVQEMKGKSGQLDLIGLSGNQLFRAELNGADCRCRLSVSLAHSGSAPRVTVMAPEEGEGTGKMEIRGPGGAHYGWISARDDGSYEILKDDQSRIVIAGSLADLSLEIKATDDGELVSTTSKSKDFVTDGVEHLEFRVLPGFDMVLVVSCVLAVLLAAP